MADDKSTSIDWDFVTKVEGGSQKRPYVLSSDKYPKGGVLVGVGVDLGQHNPNQLLISESLKEKLRPYWGLKGEDAVNIIKIHKENNTLPSLSKKELSEINKAVFDDIERKVIDTYNRHNPIVAWDDLSREQRTVIFDIGYQFGPQFTKKDGTDMDFIKQAAEGRWNDVIENLSDFGGDPSFQGRREQEIKLLNKSLQPQTSSLPIVDTSIFDINPSDRDTIAGILHG